MTNVPRAVLIGSLGATTALTVVLGVTDPAAPLYYPTWFLVLNLFLAWIPVVFAAAFAVVHRHAWLWPLGLGWLAFLPNSPYLVTDLVHLGEGVELWRHVLQYGFAAWTGIMLGVVSMRLVHDRIEREWGGGCWLDDSPYFDRIMFDRGRDRAVPALELLGFGDAARCGDGDDVRVGTFSVRIRPVDWGGTGRRSVLRIGVPDHMVTRRACGRVE